MIREPHDLIYHAARSVPGLYVRQVTDDDHGARVAVCFYGDRLCTLHCHPDDDPIAVFYTADGIQEDHPADTDALTRALEYWFGTDA